MDFRKSTLKALYHPQWLLTVTQVVRCGSWKSPRGSLLSLESAPPPQVTTKASTAGALLLTGLWFQGQGIGDGMFCEDGPCARSFGHQWTDRAPTLQLQGLV